MFGFSRRRHRSSGPRAAGRRGGARHEPMPSLRHAALPDLEAAVEQSASIPGMMSPKNAQMLYALCAAQLAEGDVVEIGSWQGYSTSFLARAVRDTGNGRLFAIDHFRGNVGREDQYVVGQADLSDLRANFEANLRRVGLWDHVTLLDMPNDQAAPLLAGRLPSGRGVRFLLIDGDHSRAGVEKDIELFFPLLIPSGAIVVFDDFSIHCPGLVEACDQLLATRPVRRRFAYRNTLVIVL